MCGKNDILNYKGDRVRPTALNACTLEGCHGSSLCSLNPKVILKHARMGLPNSKWEMKGGSLESGIHRTLDILDQSPRHTVPRFFVLASPSAWRSFSLCRSSLLLPLSLGSHVPFTVMPPVLLFQMAPSHSSTPNPLLTDSILLIDSPCLFPPLEGEHHEGRDLLLALFTDVSST